MGRVFIRSTALCLAALVAAAASARASEPPDFGPAVEISPSLPHPYYTDPDVALRDGRAVAVWNKARFGKQSWVQATALDENGQPGTVASIVASPNSGWENDPAVSISSAGSAAVVWEGSIVVPPPTARLSVLGADLSPSPAQALGDGYDPAVAFPPTGDGLLAWSGIGGVVVAPIDPAGAVGIESAIPFGDGSLRASPVIEPSADGSRVYWSSRAGVSEAKVNEAGEPQSVATVLPAPSEDYGYRDLTVSGDLLVAVGFRGRRVELTCLPLAGGKPVVLDSGRLMRSGSGPIRIGSLDVDAAGSQGLVGWVHHHEGARQWVAKAATVDERCRALRSVALPSPGRRAYDTQVGHDGKEPFALVAGGGGLEAVGLSPSGKVRASRRVARTKPLSKKLESRTPIVGLELATGAGSVPTAVWAQAHRGPGQTIAASVVR